MVCSVSQGTGEPFTTQRKTEMRSLHATASTQLQEKVAELTERFLRRKQPDFMNN